MKPQHFSKIIKKEKRRLLDALTKDSNVPENIKIIENNFAQSQSCPHCHSNRLIRWGSASNLQCYQCKECNRTFNALTKSALARLRHKDKWLTYI